VTASQVPGKLDCRGVELDMTNARFAPARLSSLNERAFTPFDRKVKLLLNLAAHFTDSRLLP
jgi:hypothetical protein